MKAIALVLLVAGTLTAKNPPSGKASDASVEITAALFDAPATKLAAGSDFAGVYTVIEVTVTPKGGKSLDLQPDDFLLRVSSNSDSSGPISAAQVYGAGSGYVLHAKKDSIGTTYTNLGNSGITAATSTKTDNTEAIKALRDKLLSAKSITSPVTGLLFFPIPKHGHRDLDLVYTSPTGKVHVEFR